MSEIEASLAKNDKELLEMRRRGKEAIDSYNAAKLASEKIKEYKDVEAALDTLAKQEEQARAKLEALTIGADKAGAEKERLSKELLSLGKELEAIAKKNSYEKNIAQSLAMIEKKSSELGAVSVDEKEMEAVQESLRKESARLGDMKAKLESCARITSGIDSQLADKAKQAANAEAMQDRISKRRAQINNLSKFKDALIETEALLRNQLISSINSMMQNIWRELYPYADYTAIRLDATKEDYALEARTGTDGANVGRCRCHG